MSTFILIGFVKKTVLEKLYNIKTISVIIHKAYTSDYLQPWMNLT